jgi:hypothetical protein
MQEPKADGAGASRNRGICWSGPLNRESTSNRRKTIGSIRIVIYVRKCVRARFQADGVVLTIGIGLVYCPNKTLDISRSTGKVFGMKRRDECESEYNYSNGRRVVGNRLSVGTWPDRYHVHVSTLHGRIAPNLSQTFAVLIWLVIEIARH